MRSEEQMPQDIEVRDVFINLESIKEEMRSRLAVDGLARKWRAILLRGAAGIVFGHVAIVTPVLSLAALAPMFGVYALTDGALAMMSALRWRGGRSAGWPFVLVGIVGMGTGLAVLVQPVMVKEFSLAEMIATWALVNGIFQIVAAVHLRRIVGGEWLLALSGIASIGLGALFTLFPNAKELAIILGIGAYAFVFGVLLVALGLRLRSRRPRAPAPRAAVPEQAWASVKMFF